MDSGLKAVGGSWRCALALHSYTTKSLGPRESVQFALGWIARFVILLLTLTGCSSLAAAQELSVTYHPVSGNWSNAYNWSGCLNGSPCVPDNSGGLTYDVRLLYVGSYVLDNVSVVSVNSVYVNFETELDLNSGNRLNLLSGNSYNYSVFQSAGNLWAFNDENGHFSTLNNDQGAYFGNTGTFAILGTVNNIFGTVQNSNLVSILPNGIPQNGLNGILNNNSYYDSSQSLGGIINTGTIKNLSTLNNTTIFVLPYVAQINNNAGGIINNGDVVSRAGVLTNVPGFLNNNANSILNNNAGGTLNNNPLSVLNNYGIVKNAGTFNNAPTATLNNSGIWINTGAVNGFSGMNKDTIQGAGTLTIGTGNSFTNQATINANQAMPLTITANGGAFTNTGTLEAANGSTLNLIGGTIANAGGTIHADPSSAVQLQSGITISGGTLTSSGTGAIKSICCGDGAALDGVTNNGTFRLIQGTELLHGAITNNGSFQVIANGAVTELNVDGSVLLGGSGNVTMSDTLDSYIMGPSQASGASLTNQNMIQGHGQIGSQFSGLGIGNSFINKGTIYSNAGSDVYVWANTGSFTNAGTLRVKAGSLMRVTGSGFSNLVSGKLSGGNYVVAGALLVDSGIFTNAANITLSGGGSIVNNRNGAQAFNHFTKNAQGGFLLLDQTVVNTSANVINAGKLTVGAGSYFQGSGSYTRTSGVTIVNGALVAPTGVDLRAGALFGNNGTVFGTVQSSGRVTPGISVTSPGQLSISGSYTQKPVGVLNISIGGPSTGTQYGRLAVQNGVSLTGS